MSKFISWKFFLSIVTVLLLVAPKAKAEGEYAWPASYKGVMLQGFYWDAYDDASWESLTAQAAELSAYFDLIWVPNSGQSGSNPSMGYNPVYWFTNHNSSFGTEDQLRTMISTYKQFGTGLIEDVVVNHRNGATNWYDFPAEEYNGKTYQLGLDAICSNDEMANAAGQPKPTGKPDTGDNFDGCRDLDHTNPVVQENICAYLDCLKNDFGYVGWRYDMVKGYAPEYTKIYNESAKAQFSVGEYWDNYDNITSWIDRTGRTSAAFDFPFKYALNDAFKYYDFSKLLWKRNGSIDQPAGLVHMDTYQRYAVTFVDNHDTYREGGKFTGDVEAANAFMLCSPGTPCVFLAHWLEHKDALKNLIAIRKSAGISNQSVMEVLVNTQTYIVAKVTGDNGDVYIKVGRDNSYIPAGYTADDKKAGNGLYTIWTKVVVKDLEENRAQLSFSPDGGTYIGGVTVKISIDNAEKFENPSIVYTTDGTTPSLSNGTKIKSGESVAISESCRLQAVAFDGDKIASGIKSAIYRTTADPIEVYVQKPESWSTINLYAWVETQITSPWPGDKMTETVTVGGKEWYHHKFDQSVKYVNVIFNNGTDQTVDIKDLELGAYYFTLDSDSGKSITVTDVTDDFAGVEGIEAGNTSVSVYPNPVTDRLCVSASKDVKAIYIYNASGALNAQAYGTSEINLESLDNGFYIYRVVFTDNTAAQGKILKK